jgi:hypothetical protein
MLKVHYPFGKKPDPTFIYPRYQEHPGQREITQALKKNFSLPEEDQASIIEIICGRGWGKTLYFVCKILIPYLNTHPGAKVMWVAPSYLVAQSPIEDVFKGMNEQTGERWVEEFDSQGNKIWEFATTRSGPVLTWWNGATVTFRSAEAPESIVSRGYNLIIMDEAALIAEQVFRLQILGTARKAGIKIFAITTPRGRKHWTYDFFIKGQDPSEKNYLSFQQAYTRNPFHNKTQAALVKDIPDWLYRQEYLAEFIEDGDSVFRGLDSVIDGAEISYPGQHQEWAAEQKDVILDTPQGQIRRKWSERRFVVGLDLAKSVDYTVYWVLDCETGETVYYKRVNKTDYKDILKTAQSLCQTYNGADLVFDATGVGSGLADMMSAYDIVAHPFVFTNDTKSELVTRLAVAIEHGQIKIPNIVTVKNELSAFTYQITRTGKITYNAPTGFHDDIVMALALANWFRVENEGTDQVSAIDEVIAFNERQSRGNSGSFFDFMDDDND